MEACCSAFAHDTASLWLVAAGGLLGSAHCIGMCGPIVAVAEGVRPGRWTPWSQWPLHGGRLTTYALLGALAGLLGSALESAAVALGLSGLASALAGVTMVLFALVLLNWLPWRQTVVAGTGAVNRFVRALTSGRPLGSFALGMQWGLLPCGLVWAMLPAAAGTGSPVWGALTMVVFGVGTVPALLLAGGLAGLMGPRLRSRLPQIAASSVLALGVLLILRGAAGAGLISHVALAPGVPLF